MSGSNSQTSWDSNFWGEGNKGFAVVDNRLEEGFNSLNEFSGYFGNRAKLETEYATHLEALAKSSAFKADHGTLKAVLDKLIVTTHQLNEMHLSFAKKLIQDVDVPLGKFKNAQRQLKKHHEAEMDKATKNVQKEVLNVDKLKKDYYAKCNAMKAAVQTAAKGQTDRMTKKEYEKIQEKAIKAKKDVDTSELEYKNAVKKYEQAQDVWDEKMAQAAQEIQRNENERLALIKSTLANILDAQLKMISDAHVKNINELRQSVESINVDADMNEWMNKNKTGDVKAVRIKFESFFGDVAPKKAAMIRSSSQRGGLNGSQGDLLSQTSSQAGINRSKTNLLSSIKAAKENESNAALSASGSSSNVKAALAAHLLQSQNSQSGAAISENDVSRARSSLKNLSIAGNNNQSNSNLSSPLSAVAAVAERPQSEEQPSRQVVAAPENSKKQEESSEQAPAASKNEKVEQVKAASESARKLTIETQQRPTDLVKDGVAAEEQQQQQETVKAAKDAEDSQNAAAAAAENKRQSALKTADSGFGASPMTASVSAQAQKFEQAAQSNSTATATSPIRETAPQLSASEKKPAEQQQSSEQSAKVQNPQVAAVAAKERVFTRRSIKMEGWMDVCDDSNKQWVKRWCALEGGYIWFFEDQADNSKPQGMNKPKSMASVAKSTLSRGNQVQGWEVPDVAAKGPHLLTLNVGGKRQMLLSCSDEDDCNYWYEQIDSVIKKK
ncbi:hypothetical protein MP228_012481 [Amoeboaphelidium protococcarum]|nr:hypothetical protein MP228_012481 [Amoeboaphelidium protococcarum]